MNVQDTMDGLPSYPRCRPSGVEWLGDVPEHWGVLAGRACYTSGQVLNKGMLESRVLSLSYGQIKIRPEASLHGLVPESFETYQIIDPGDIVCRPTDLQNDWNSLRFGLSRHRGIITAAYMCLRTTSKLDRRYGHILLHAYDLKKVFYGLGSGLRQNLGWADFKSLPCLLPPLPEQRAIVWYLDYVDRRIRRYVAAKRRLIGLLDEEKQAIVNRAVTRGLDPNVRLKPSGVEWLGDVPEHWEIRRLKAVCQLAYGDSLPAVARDDGIVPVFGSNGPVGVHTEANTEAPCIVLGRKGSFGKVHYSTRPVFAIDTTYYVDERHSTANLAWLSRALGWLRLDAVTRDSAIPGLNREEAYDQFLPLPPVHEQTAIAEYLDKVTADIDAAIGLARRQVELVEEYRTRLIADVVTGKLDVREAAEQLPDEAESDVPSGESGPQENGLAKGPYDAEKEPAIAEEVTT